MKKILKGIQLVSVLVATLLFVACDDDDAVLPTVEAGFTQTINQESGIVRFINTSENADSYEWKIDDVVFSTEANPVRTFGQSGTYTIQLEAKNVSGASATATDTITITLPEEGDSGTITACEGGSLINDFENATNAIFGTEGGFGGGAGSIIENPTTNVNSSANLGQYVKNAGEDFAGITLAVDPNVEINGGVFSIDVKSTAARQLLFKLEGDGFDNTELVQATSGIGWQTLTYDFSNAANNVGTLNGITLIMDNGTVGDGSADWTIQFDNIRLCSNGDNGGGNNFDSGLLTNGDFENGTTPWTLGLENAISEDLLATENGNTFFSIPVDAAGNPFDVNLSHTGLDITEGTTYTLTFDAWSDVDRDIIAGIGLSGGDFTSQTTTASITTTRATYTLDLVANFTDNANARILFDLGAQIGRVNIDNVNLSVNTDGGGNNFDSGLLINGDFESGVSPWNSGVQNAISEDLLVTENGNTYFSVPVDAAGDAFNVNLSQLGLDISEGTTYTLTFDAWSDVNRDILAGIGLSGGAFTSQTTTTSITTMRSTYVLDLVANFTDNTNARVLFDLGAQIGRVNIDNVNLSINSDGGNGGGSGGALFQEDFSTDTSANWAPLADASGKPTEVNANYLANGGETDGGLEFVLVNATGGAFIHRLEATGIDFSGITNAELRFSLKLSEALNATAVQSQFQALGTSNVDVTLNNLETMGLNDTSFTVFTIPFTVPEGANGTIFFDINLATGNPGAGGVIIDNIEIIEATN